MKPPVVVCAEASELEAAAARVSSEGWHLRRGFQVPDAPWELAARRWVCVGEVVDGDEARAAAWALVRGCALVVALAPMAPPDFVDDLGRAGSVRRHRNRPSPATPLGSDERDLLALLADGRSVGEAAACLYLSLRTAQRRLATARAALGVATNREAVIAWRRSERDPA